MRLILILLLLTGCSQQIVNRDFEREEAAYVKQYSKAKTDPLYQAPTPKSVMLADKDGISIAVYAGKSVKSRGMELQQWFAVLSNSSDRTVCVSVDWNLLDFELVSDYPMLTQLSPNKSIDRYATITQVPTTIGDMVIPLPPSGYVKSLNVTPLTAKSCDKQYVDER